MTELTALTADGLREYFPNISIEAYRYEGPPMDRNRVILFAAYSCLFIIGMASNCYVAFVLASILRLKCAETPRAIRVFVFALCCCDIWVLAFVPLLLFDLIYNQWAVPSSLLCQLYLCSESVNKFCGPFLLVALSGFCYWKICRPISGGGGGAGANGGFKETLSVSEDAGGGTTRRLISTVGASGRGLGAPLAVVLLCGLAAFSLVTPVYLYGDLYYLVVHNGSEVRLIMAKCVFHPPENFLTAFTIYCFLFGYVLPASLFTIFYLAVVYRVKRQAPLVLRTSTPGMPVMNAELTSTTTHLVSPTFRQVVHLQPRSRRLERATRTCVGLILFYIACWSPYWAMNLKNYFYVPNEDEEGAYKARDIDVVAAYFVHLLPYINVAGYPILHALLNRNIRRDCKRLRDKRIRKRCNQLAAEENRSSCHPLPVGGSTANAD